MKRVWIILGAGMLAACAHAPQKSAAPSVAGKALGDKAAESPLGSDNKEVMEALMAGEFAWQDGRAASAARHYARAAAHSADARVAERATRVAVVAREWELARESLQRWIELDPQSMGVVQAQLSLALVDGDQDRAWASLRHLLAVADGSGRTLAAQALLGPAEPQRVHALLLRAETAKEIPGGAEAGLLLSQVAQQQKQPELAVRLADRAVQRFPKAAKPLLWRGHLALRLGDREAARRYLARAAELEPGNQETLLAYAALLNELKQPAEAARALQGLPNGDEVLSALAAYAATANDTALMEDAYTRLQALPEPRPDARFELLAQLAELLQRKQAALDWYRQVPKGERYWNAQFRSIVLEGELAGHAAALAHLERLRQEEIDQDQQMAESYLLEAELQRRQGNGDAVLEAYRRGLEALPSHRGLLYARGLYHANAGRIAQAEADLRRVLELNPQDTDAMNALGYTLVDQTPRVAEGAALVAQAYALKPDEAAIMDSMGWAAYRLGKYEEAEQHLRRAFNALPDAEVAAHWGEVLWVMGRKDEARTVWQQGLAKDPENSVLRDTMRRLGATGSFE